MTDSSPIRNPCRIEDRKERDAETGLDYFGARYFSGAQGRFTGPGAPLADQEPDDPQSWNLYAYTRNDPLRTSTKMGAIKLAITAFRVGKASYKGYAPNRQERH